jgi:hypothetical protein
MRDFYRNPRAAANLSEEKDLRVSLENERSPVKVCPTCALWGVPDEERL